MTIDKRLYDLNRSIVKDDDAHIRVHFDELCKIACQKRNRFSAVWSGNYSTDTESAKYLLSQFSSNDKLLKLLDIEDSSDREQKIEQIRAKMLQACNESVVEAKLA